MKIKYIAIFLILLCCFVGAVSATEDVSVDDAIVSSDDVAADEVVSEVDSGDESLAEQADDTILAVENDNQTVEQASEDSPILSESSSIYVDPTNGDDSNDGSSNSSAVKTINSALTKVSAGGTIILNEGNYADMIMPQKSVSFVGVNRENTILSGMIMAMNSGSLNFNNLTITSQQIMFAMSCNFTNVDFKTQMIILQAQTPGSYYNILNCSFVNPGIVFSGAQNAYYATIKSSNFIDKTTGNVIQGDYFSSLSIDYCSFINCQNVINTNNKNVNITNSYFGMNDASSINNVNVTNWVVMTFENTTELHESGDASFIVSFKKVAHADGTFTDLEHPELLSFPTNEVTYTLINGTEVTHTLENLEDASTFTITGSGTIRATAAGQTLRITIGKDITLNIEKYEAIGYGGEQDLVFISNYNNITGTMKVTITGPNYSKEETLDIYGGRAFLTLKDLNVGDYTVDVTYSGDDVYYPATNSTTFKVLPVASDDITLKVYVNDIVAGEAANILVFVGPNGATGSVTITINGNDTTEDLDGNGIASFSIKDLPENNYTIAVKYNGDANFEAASATADLKVMPNTVVENLTEQLNQTKADLANKTAEVAKAQEQVTKLTNDLNTANKKAAAASNSADAKIKR